MYIRDFSVSYLTITIAQCTMGIPNNNCSMDSWPGEVKIYIRLDVNVVLLVACLDLATFFTARKKDYDTQDHDLLVIFCSFNMCKNLNKCMMNKEEII